LGISQAPSKANANPNVPPITTFATVAAVPEKHIMAAKGKPGATPGGGGLNVW